MIVCIDSGNSRIKWGVSDSTGTWLENGAVDQAESGKMADLAHRLPLPAQVMLANVAGAATLTNIVEALAPWRAVLHEVRSTAAAGGVVNQYENPAQLGVDRWCALIGARALSAAPCVVVMAGTATTIDTLDGEGRFLGGLILPGLDLMHRSLARDTAALPLAAGTYSMHPRCTDDAIVSGCIEALVGAIERAVARLGSGAECLLSGGAANVLGRYLDVPHRTVGNLVLEGLRRLAGTSPAPHATGKISG
ncbi:MAG: type III pantothenate kinase [Azonexus sp.]